MSIFELVKSAKMRTLLMTEAVARVVKHMVEEKCALLRSFVCGPLLSQDQC